MKYFIASFIFCLSFGVLQGQTSTKTTYYDLEKQKIKERYTISDAQPGVLNGAYENYFSSGKIKCRGQYKNSAAVGNWEFYYEKGPLQMAGPLRDNQNHGFWKYYYENGNIRKQGDIYNGKKEGEWIYYFENEQVKQKGKI